MKILAKSEALGVDLASAFDASPNPYMLLTPDLRFAGMNRAYLEVTRSERAALLGRHVFEVFDADGDTDNVRQLRESLERVLATGETDHIALLRYAIPLPDETGLVRYTDRYWSCTHSPVTDDHGALRYVLQHATDITELHNLRSLAASAARGDSALDLIAGGRLIQTAEQIQASNQRLKTERNNLIDMFMQTPGFVCVLTGPDHVFQMHNGAYAQLIGHRDIAGKPIREALPEIVGQGYFRFLDSVYATGEPHQGRNSQVMLQREPGGPLEAVYLDFIYQPIRDGSGQVAGIFVQGYDVTDTVLAAERQKLMIDELNHRVKNTLATVQSIAVQTARSHADPRTFAEGFQARLLALSHTHDLLTRSHWEGADLGAILEHETEAHGPHRVTLVGPPVALGPAAALSFGMIFHELATNAAKYGALSAPEGRVLVDWAVADQAHPVLHLTWREIDGPPAAEPGRRGFGSRLIERNVRHDLAGEVKLDYASGGFSAEFSVPLYRGRSS
ncbi:MAG: HWE histidine kinase domain-containing protein [Brevundimonas sp.]|uniref:sensor histidine kinase n=1 Tax=Brevundimonas sp. TaxID=1871086 RepID=UPI002718D17A|nr:HWE histidine kinase domain-containing protein [Brevundimonas sp.]MDZ4320325.1 HWE histidine kinase domain-containing protein [Phenylobacterium sp.]MDO9588414.1 HWE histidine kinase domain-containing protein [Brevundimonas sp.]MDP3369560.1 HWE histidine kinase domain-containing protein [Brevundimonas sp.]MDP3656217.1 HWE histidine kinase domain-containing protein [Brevundimonas sp.]MDZ4113778.1 HWE histidine kinase domain-containing protein [Brevundimonas sp.]